MLEDKRLDRTQQLSQLLEPLLCFLACLREVTLAERRLLDVKELATFVKSVIDERGLGEV